MKTEQELDTQIRSYGPMADAKVRRFLNVLEPTARELIVGKLERNLAIVARACRALVGVLDDLEESGAAPNWDLAANGHDFLEALSSNLADSYDDTHRLLDDVYGDDDSSLLTALWGGDHRMIVALWDEEVEARAEKLRANWSDNTFRSRA